MGTDPIACESNASSSNEDNFKNGNQTENLLDNHNSEDDNSIQRSSSDVFDEENVTEGSIEAADNYVPLSPHITKSCSKGGTTSPGRKKSPNPPTSNRELNGSHSTSDSSHTSLHSTLDSSRSVDFDNTILRNGFKGHQNAASESQELLLDSEVSNSFSHSPYPRTHPLTNSTHSRSHSSITDTGDTSLSQLSATAAENRSSAESTQLAHLFKVHSLQEELSDLKSKLNDRDIPLDTIVEGFRRILQEHQQLTMDVDVSSAHLDTIREKDGGKPMDPVTKTKRAIGNEVHM